MLDLSALLGLLPPLKEWLTDSKNRRRLHDERGQRAVHAILRAVNETKLYLAAQVRTGNSDQKRKDDLSRYWTEAASALHGLNDDLARRCRLKGAFWAEPQKWSEKDLGDARILLRQVAKDADTLLGWNEISESKKEED